MGKQLLTWLLPLAAVQAFFLDLQSVNFGTYGVGEEIQIYGNTEAIQSLSEESAMMGDDVWSLALRPLDAESDDLSSIVGMNCEIVHDILFPDSQEPLPLTDPGYFYFNCLPDTELEDGVQYAVFAIYTMEEDTKEVNYRDVNFYFDASAQPRLLGRFSQQWNEDRVAAKFGTVTGGMNTLRTKYTMGEQGATGLTPRGGSPSISGLLPSKASPKGGVYITIYGTNLASKQINLGGGQGDNSDEGEDYVIYLEKDADRVFCIIDRMLTLHGQPVDGKEFRICKSPEVPVWGTWRVWMIIDGGDPINCGTIRLEEGYSPTISYIYPAAEAPAKPKDAYDYEGAFWTAWYNTDTPSDGVEDETLLRIQTKYRSDFQHCSNPIGIEVYDVTADEPYRPSVDNNADGLSTPKRNSAFYGHLCKNDLQTVSAVTGLRLAECNDVKVRFYCVPGVTEFTGRVYTAVHGRSDAADIHANRLHETPKLVDESDGFKAEMPVHLNDGQNCGSHANCGMNQGMMLKVVSGNDGVYQTLPKAAMPGAYNITFQTHHNGNSVPASHLLNYLTNDDLFPVTFEVYPQIKSVSPQVGSLSGGTLLTIKGTGFIPDGKGGTVEVMVGNDKCTVESMTETQILCRTLPGVEEPKPFGAEKTFVETPEMSSGEYHTQNWPTSKVATAAQCIEMCRTDASCYAYIFNDGHGCWHIDHLGPNKTDITDWFADKWHVWAGAKSGHVDPATMGPETDCFTGRGYYYEGDANHTTYNTECEAGTFCRNPSPHSHKRPYCKDTTGHWRDCRIVRCDEKWGKYLGNRGLDTDGRIGAWKDGFALEQQRKAEMTFYKYTAPNGKIHVSKYHNGQNGYWGQYEKGTENSNIRARTNFVAPYDGVFKFIASADDRIRGNTDFDQETGQYKELTAHNWYACSLFNLNCRSGHLHSKKFDLKKGETVPVRWSYTNGNGPGYMKVAVQYLGTDTSHLGGTWIDHRPKEDFTQDSYRYQRDEFAMQSTYREDQTWMLLKWDEDLVNDGTGLEGDETFSSDKRAQFRIKLCGDDNNCHETPDLSADDSDHPDDFEDTLRDHLKLFSTTTCEKKGSMNPVHFTDGYETSKYWPHHHHYEDEAGHWCGRKAHESHNHDFFYHSRHNGAIDTGKYDDVCFAHRGEIERLYIYVKYKYVRQSDGATKDRHAWMRTDELNWKAQSWTWRCFSLKDIINDGTAHNNWEPVKDGTNPTVWHMRPSNAHSKIVYFDELHIGKVRGSFEMQQTKKALSYDGVIPHSWDVYKSNNKYGCRMVLYWKGSNHWRSDCGYNSVLPEILPPSGSDFTIHGNSDTQMTSGNDWTTSNPPVVNLYDGTDVLDGLHIDPEATKKYRYARYNYVDKRDKIRHIMHVHVLKRSDVDEDMAGEIELFYGDDPVPFMMPFSKEACPGTIQKELHDRWPELNDQNLKTRLHKGGDCNNGYRYYIDTHNHGRMKQWSLGQMTLTNSRNKSPRTDGPLTRADPGVVTHVMPGSVTAVPRHYPQVVITANGQRSACDNCDFVYAADHTMVVTGITGDNAGSITKGDSLTVSYDLKSYNGKLNEMVVYTGKVAMVNCNAPSATEVTCEVGDVPEGTHSIMVDIPQLGQAMSADTFSVSKSITSHSPTVGSQHGGTLVTVMGAGFEEGQVVTVDIGGSPTQCDSTGLAVTYSKMICRTMANNNIAGGDTPTLTSNSLNKYTILGKEVFTLNGAQLSNDQGCDGKVLIGEDEAKIISWSDSEIIAETPAGMKVDNDADTKVYVCNKGYTNTMNTSVQLRINSVSAAFSSLNGGRVVTIDGFGFETDDVTPDTLEVSAGDIPCTILSATKSQIVCSTGAYNNRVELMLGATGIKKVRGMTDASDITIEVGNEVHWAWNIQIPGVTPKVHFQRVSSQGDAEGNDFWSEEFMGSEGNFVKHFDNTKSAYHYSTGYMDSATIFQSGTIRVVAATDKALKLSVKVNDVAAEHKGNSDNTQPSGDCDSSGASSTPVMVEEDGFFITYSWATTPVLSKYDVTSPEVGGLNMLLDLYPYVHSPTAKMDVTMKSIIMDDCSSHMEVTVSGYDCVERSFNNKKFTCDLDPNDSLDIAKAHKVNINVAPMGNVYFTDYTVKEINGANVATMDDAFDIVFGPYVDTVSPSAPYSKFGDVELSLDGHGFVSGETTEVIFTDQDNRIFGCAISSLTYTNIQCRLERIVSGHTNADHAMNAFIKISGDGSLFNNNGVTSSFIFGTYQFFDRQTPKVTSIDPVQVTESGQELTITGEILAGLDVWVGGESCTDVIVAGNGNSATCTLPNMEVGQHAVTFHAEKGFVVTNDFEMEVSMAVASVSPVVGGTHGGLLVTITGFGFSEDTVVQMYNDDEGLLCEFCYKESFSATEIVFYTPASRAGAATITVSHEFLNTNIAPFDFTYELTEAQITGVSGGSVTDGLAGGETVVIVSPNVGKCAETTVEIHVPMDPCAAGQHYCAYNADCLPTADGTDYTCNCTVVDDWNGYGPDCTRFHRPRSDKPTVEEGIEECHDDDYEIFNIASKHDEKIFEELLLNVEVKNSGDAEDRGVYFSWYGTPTCGRLNADTMKLEMPGDCSTWGDTEKKSICKRYPSRNCYHHEIDNGKYSYNGYKSSSLTGFNCINWWDIPDGNDVTIDKTDYDNKNNYCRNNHNSAEGINCGLFHINDGRGTTMSCGIPRCKDVSEGKKMQQCTVRSAAPIDYDKITKSDATAEGHYPFDRECYIGSRNKGKVNNPRRCYDYSRRPQEIRFEAVDVEQNIYKIIMNDEDRYLYSDLNGESKMMYTSSDQSIIDGDRSSWYVEKDVFGPGLWSIRTVAEDGNYFLRAPPSNSGNMDLTHQNLLAITEQLEVAWIIECTSDNYGSLIEQPVRPFTKVAEIAPSCQFGRNAKMTIQMPSLPAGSYKIVGRNAEYGAMDGSVDITYGLTISSVSPNKVGTGGGSRIVISGSGFSESTVATLCNTTLTFASYIPAPMASDPEMIAFDTVPFDFANCAGNPLMLSSIDAATGDVITGSLSARNGGFQVDNSLTPKVTSLTPKMGGTAGGTVVTITGTGFGTDVGNADVTIHGVACAVQSVSDTEIQCLTDAFPRDGTPQVAVDPVVTISGGPGLAVSNGAQASDTQFWYIDRWSSPYTWGCSDDSCKPQEGEIIVIPDGQVILLDETTPVLSVLIVDGGKFIWDRSDGIELHMHYGVINNGGHFEIGTEDEPFCSGNALIKMYGHQRSINLPIYGAKVLAVRFGTIDIHGCPKTTTWTELDATAEAGDTSITLTHPVKDDWFVGDEIIIAATGDITNFHRSEKRNISSVSTDGYTVFFDEALEHRHISVCSNGPGDNGFGWGWAGTLCTRGEVGLLTRNVKMMGNFHQEWAEDLEECELGIGTAFGTQTCFQNRFGHETGSDQFGSTLFLHKPTYAKIEFFEVTHAGQAFNLARYPIHFHTPGSLPTSYVRGCGIHNTFNRALTMHGVHNLTVEFNVIYNVMGLAFFLEDAVEEDNIIRYNLGIMNKKSSSLLNIDSTPAVFWIPNPNNIFYGNHAAGGSHMGFWFNPPDEPTGPSAQMDEYQNFCVKNRPLGQFYNNTAHSMGQYGMWIFVDLTPTVNGACGDTEPKAIKFGALPDSNENGPVPQNTLGFFAWHCMRGAEWATGGAIQFHNMVVANNWVAGLSGKETFLSTYAEPGMEEQASMFKRNIVIGHLDGDIELRACGDMGIETPWKMFATTVDDIQFYNYDSPTPNLASVDLETFAMRDELGKRRCLSYDPCYGSNAFDCGAVTRFSNVTWYNSNRRMQFAWEHEAASLDLDGTFYEGDPMTYVIAKSEAFDKDMCEDDPTGKYMVGGFPAQICVSEKNGKTFKPHRFMFNGAKPDSLEGMSAVFESQHGITKSPFRNCRPRGNGWMVLLDGNEEYSMHFENFDHISNISFNGDIDDFEKGEWLTIRHDFPEKIDYAILKKGSKEEGNRITEWPTDPLTASSYDYHVENVTQPYSVRYTFNGQENVDDVQISQHGGATTWGEDFFLGPNFYKCFFKDCIPPPPANVTTEPPLVDCNFLDCMGGAMPADFADLHVQNGMRMMIDKAAVSSSLRHMKFGSVFVDGTFEISADSLNPGEHLLIEADHMVINTGMGNDTDMLSRRRRDVEYVTNGKIVIGTADNPIPCDRSVEIRINGDQNSRSFGALAGLPPIGAKALGGFGGIEMHGCAPSSTWTTLTNTVNAGDDKINVNDDLTGWKVGDEIALASSDVEHRHTEYFAITGINGQEISLNTTVEWRHLGSATTTDTFKGRTVDQAAEVALLTRNIKIDGTGGAEGKVGGRIIIFSWTQVDGIHEYVRQGYGQFENVEFKGMGQFGYTNFDDLRAQILFWNIDPSSDVAVERNASYVKGCSFHQGYHTAVAAMMDTDNLLIDNNIIFGCVDDGIRTDSKGVTITNNVIGNVFYTALWQQIVENGLATNNFEEDQLPACINTGETDDVVIQNNRCAGADGGCFEGRGEECSDAETCTTSNNGVSNWLNNQGHSCAAGYFNIKYKRDTKCTKFANFYFYKIGYYGITWISPNHHVIVENTIIVDTWVGMFGVTTTAGDHETNTIKNSYIAGRSANYDCTYDKQQQADMYLSKFAKSLKPSQIKGHTAVMFPSFLKEDNGFPICAIDGEDKDVNTQGLTCFVDTHFADFNRKCGDRDFLMSTNVKNLDWTFPIHITGGSKSNLNNDDLVLFKRPDIGTVNIADCVDLFCDGLMKGKVQDFDGGVFDVAGTIMAEAEYEWDGVTRTDADGNDVTYKDTRDGLGDYRIPKPLLTNLDGSRIPLEDLVNDYGVHRSPNCEWRPQYPGWFCPGADNQYYDMIYEMLDEDKDRRRLTPLATLSEDGYIDISNGPGDHSCCIGYACQIRLMTIHTTMACGVSYDYFFSSTTPLKARFHFPDAPADCLVKIKFYSKRPNRIDLKENGQQVLATNALNNGGNIEWLKPDASYIPTLDGNYNTAGSNYHERHAQLFHLIIGGGNTYDLEVVSTLVLELDVMTELTEDEFYDNGNLAANIAALLGIDPDKIRVMNVIREDAASRRKRRALAGMDIVSFGPRRFRRSDDSTALQFEIDPSSKTTNGANANNELGKSVASMGKEIANVTANTIVNEMNDATATVADELAVAAAPVPVATPPEPVTLAEQLGMEDIQMGENLTEFLEKIQEELDVDLEELETADERNAKAQEEADAALEAIVYTTPDQLIMSDKPTMPQIRKVKLYQNFVLTMLDTNGNVMPNVGFVTDPWTVSISLTNTVLDGTTNPSIDGNTVVQFKAGDGRATFDNVIIKGDVKSTQFKFTVMDPSNGGNGGVSEIISDVIEFLPPANDESCDAEYEGAPFDKKEAWTVDCSFVCLQSCAELDGMLPICEPANTCSGTTGLPTFGVCGNNGCECDPGLVPAEDQIAVGDYMSAQCDSATMTLRVNKCVMNKFGFMLKHLYIGGATENDFGDLVDNADPKCRGRLGFGEGPEYVFDIDRSKSECGMTVANNDTHVIFDSGIQGYHPVYELVNTNARELFVGFGCAFPIDLSSAINLGAIGSQSETNVIGGTDITLGIFSDSSYTKVEKGALKAEPGDIYFGITAAKSNLRIQADTCWLSSVYDEDDPTAGKIGDLIVDGCSMWSPVEGNYESSQIRFKIPRFALLSQIDTNKIYLQCEVNLCDASQGACAAQSCPGNSPDAATTLIKTEISLDLSVGNDACAAANCDNCQAMFAEHLCTCPQGQTLQGDGSCVRKQKWKGQKWKKKWNTK